MSDGAAVPRKVRQELKEFADNRQFESFAFKVRTVTSSVDAVIKDNVEKDVLVSHLHENAKVYGLLTYLASVYVNVLVDDPAVSHLASRIIFDCTVLRHIVNSLSTFKMRKANKTAEPRLLDMDLYKPVKAHLDSYVENRHGNGLSPEILERFRKCGRRPIDFASRNMAAANKRHVEQTFEESARPHMQCFVEQRMWNFQGLENFHTLTKKASQALYDAAVASTADQARELIDGFCDRNTIESWKAPLLDIMPTFRALFEDVREFGSPISKLRVLYQFRRELRPLYEEHARVRGEIDVAQPHVECARVKDKYNKEKIVAQRGKLKEVPIPPWFDSTEAVTDRQVHDLQAAVKQSRKKLYDEKKVPGLDSLPKSFSLLPQYSLSHAFVQYDNESIRQLAPGVVAREDLEAVGSRTWWTPFFDFHSKRKLDRRPPPAKNKNRKKRKLMPQKGNKLPRKKMNRKKKNKKKEKKKKILRQKRSLRCGIPLCVQHSWVPDDERYREEKQKQDGPIPWLVCSITSDGLQVKVLLATIVKKLHSELDVPSDNSSPQPVKEPLPPGVRQLDNKGYQYIRRRFDISRNTRGLFKNAHALPRDFRGTYQVIGLDPGQVKIGTSVRAEVDLSLGSREEAKDAMKQKQVEQSNTFVTNKTYRFESLARVSQKNEQERRKENVQYRAALNDFSQVTLKRAGESVEYANVVYSTLGVMCRELLTRKRRRQRFARFRAKARNIHDMAKTLAYGAENEELRSSPSRGAAKRQLKQELYRKKRVVFFGNAEFGHGSRGPCPRKRLLRALSLLCPVVLVDEFRTSIRCKGCGHTLQGNHRSRVFHCSNNPTGGSEDCSTTSIDRDTNGATNIATVGLHQLLGLPRPPHLSRPSRTPHP